jgi:hypothetical protein
VALPAGGVVWKLVAETLTDKLCRAVKLNKNMDNPEIKACPFCGGTNINNVTPSGGITTGAKTPGQRHPNFMKSKAKTAKRNPGRLQRPCSARRIEIIKSYRVTRACGHFDSVPIEATMKWLKVLASSPCGYCAKPEE